MSSRILFFFLLFGIFSCTDKDDKNGEINLRFHLVYDDQPMEMFKNYPYPVTNEPFYLSRLSFYISDLSLKNVKTTENLKDIDFLNFTNTFTGGVPTNGYEYKISDVTPGDYTSLEFGVGVPKALNAKAPADYPAGTILSKPTEYWDSWKSYVFFKTEGSIVFDSSAPKESDFALHLGGDEAYRTIVLPKSVTVQSGKTTNVDITLDVKKYFSGVTDYDIEKTQTIHSLSQMPLIIALMNNLTTAFK